MKLIPLGLNAKKHKGHFAKVDDEDYEELMKYLWHVKLDSGGSNFYATMTRWDKGNQKCVHIPMHRYITKPSPGMHVDHINGDTLDNRRDNLRVCTRAQNQRNKPSRKGSSSKYKGVSWNRRVKRWRAQIFVKPKVVYLGDFESEEAAARVYDAAALEYFGEFALLNFPDR